MPQALPRRPRRLAPALFCLASWLASPAVIAGTDDEVRAMFERFVAVQNAHDLKALESLLADSPNFLWITRGNVIWGREAALKRFGALYEGTWRLAPEFASLRVVALDGAAAQLHVPVVFTTGAVGQPAQTTRVFLNQVLVKQDGVWRVTSILPIVVPAQ